MEVYPSTLGEGYLLCNVNPVFLFGRATYFRDEFIPDKKRSTFFGGLSSAGLWRYDACSIKG
jgi:hypothetical protein